MTEETISEMFPPYEWREAMCSGCVEYKGCVSMADDPVCYSCLESFYDDDGEHIAFEPESIVGTKTMMLLNTAVTFLLGAASAIALALAFLAPFLITSDEVIAFWRGI